MHPTAKLREGKEGLPGLKAALARLSRERVLVGIPEGTAERKTVEGKAPPVNNAQLMFIHAEGSALRNLPKRRVLQPAIEAKDNWQRIERQMKKVGDAELDGDHGQAMEELRKAGQIGSNAAKRWFTDSRNGWPPNSPLTIERKLSRLSVKQRADADAQIASQGGDTRGVVTTLVDLDEMRRAITYAVEE